MSKVDLGVGEELERDGGVAQHVLLQEVDAPGVTRLIPMRVIRAFWRLSRHLRVSGGFVLVEEVAAQKDKVHTMIKRQGAFATSACSAEFAAIGTSVGRHWQSDALCRAWESESNMLATHGVTISGLYKRPYMLLAC